MLQKIAAAVQYIQNIKPSNPKVGIILGSGLGAYTENIKIEEKIPYSEIPHFLPTSVKGHTGQLILGKIDTVEIVLLQGRIHAYEGQSMDDIVFPVRVLSALGIEVLVLTNASGGINSDYSQGDLILIEDHINLMGNNPLVGPNISELGTRFPDMTYAYHPKIRELFHTVAKECQYNLRSGVYCALLGPTYETPAEIRMLKILGADMVGMSTVPECLAANHLGLKVLGLSCITNMAAGITKNKLSHEEISGEAKKALNIFSKIMNIAIKRIAESTETLSE